MSAEATAWAWHAPIPQGGAYPARKLVLLCVANSANEHTGEFQIIPERIAMLTGLHANTVRLHLAALEGAGLLELLDHQPRSKGRFGRNTYRINMRPAPADRTSGACTVEVDRTSGACTAGPYKRNRTRPACTAGPAPDKDLAETVQRVSRKSDNSFSTAGNTQGDLLENIVPDTKEQRASGEKGIVQGSSKEEITTERITTGGPVPEGPHVWMWRVMIEEGMATTRHSLITLRKGKLNALYQEHLKKAPDPAALFRSVCVAVKMRPWWSERPDCWLPEKCFNSPVNREAHVLWALGRDVEQQAPPARPGGRAKGRDDEGTGWEAFDEAHGWGDLLKGAPGG